MKFLSVYEAFKSNTLSKVQKFIKKNLDKRAGDLFLDQIKSMGHKLDLPISEIEENDITYLNSSLAKKVKIPEGWVGSGDDAIYAIKFWFSLKDGYLGKTGIGNKKIRFERGNPSEKFTEIDFDYIKRTLGIKTGKLVPVNNNTFHDLETGDKIIAFYGDGRSHRRLGPGVIFIDTSSGQKHVYAIQELSGGGEPSISGWKQFGEMSWNIGNYNGKSSDNACLHRYIENDDPIENSYNEEKNENILDFNLPIRSHSRWDNHRWELYNWHNLHEGGHKIIKNSDYCVILNLDNILERTEKVSEIGKKRNDSRKGATFLMSDEELKNINIVKFLTKILNSMGINKDLDKSNNLKNLKKIIKRSVCVEFPVISIITRADDVISTFISRLRELLRTETKEIKKQHLNRMMSDYREQSIIVTKMSTQYKLVYDALSKNENENIKTFIGIIKDIDELIINYLEKSDVNTIMEFKSIQYKFNYIKSFLNDGYFDLKIVNILSKITSSNGSAVIGYINDHGVSDEEIEKLEKIKLHIKSIL